MVIFLTERVLTSRVFTATFLLVRCGDTLHRRENAMFPVDSQTQKLLARERAELLAAGAGPAVAPRRVAAWRSRRRSGPAARTRSRSPLGAHLTRRGGSATVSSPACWPTASGPRPASFLTGRLVLRTETEAGLAQLRFVLGADDDHTRVPRALSRRRAARGPDPPPERPPPASARRRSRTRSCARSSAN